MPNEMQPEHGISFSVHEQHQTSGVLAEHIHNFYELYYLTDGKVRYFIDGEIFPVQAGDIVMVKKGVIHKTVYYPGIYARRMLLHFDAGILEPDCRSLPDELGKRGLIRPPSFLLPETDAIFSRLKNEFEQRGSHYLALCKNLLCELLILLCRQKNNLENKKTLSDNELIIQNASKYIAAHYQENLSLPELSSRFAMSPSHFSRMFKMHTGFGVVEYITLTRIANAERLLRYTHLPITEIAVCCGFNDSNYFASIFKRKKGLPPHRYAAAFRAEGGGRPQP